MKSIEQQLEDCFREIDLVLDDIDFTSLVKEEVKRTIQKFDISIKSELQQTFQKYNIILDDSTAVELSEELLQIFGNHLFKVSKNLINKIN
jgi:hypothetical protein